MLEISETFLDSRKPTELENSGLLGELYVDKHEVEHMGTNVIGIALSEKWHDSENTKFNTNMMTYVSDSHLSQELKPEATKNNTLHQSIWNLQWLQKTVVEFKTIHRRKGESVERLYPFVI
jgi:hypothetical protein